MEQLTIAGRIGQDAEVKEINGKFVVNCNIAVDDSYKNEDGERIERTRWYQCSKFSDKRPPVAQHLRKGAFVIVQGIPRPRHYRNSEDKLIDVIDIQQAQFDIKVYAKKEESAES